MAGTNGMQGAGDKEKAHAAALIERSVQSPPPETGLVPTSPGAPDWIFWIGQVADSFIPWGQSPKQRDQQLRTFMATEPLFMSALGSVAARNAGFSWKLSGPEESVGAAQDMLVKSNFGGGWQQLMVQITLDLCTQDNGAFIELIRARDSETAEVVNIAHLDARRCWPTGDPEIPVLYNDRIGAWHALKWYQVVQLLEIPAPVELANVGPLFKLQYCVLSRLLRAAQIMRDVEVYHQEKVAGRHENEVVLVKGVTAEKVQNAITINRSVADSEGYQRFIRSPIVGSSDPEADVGHDVIQLAKLPEGFSYSEWLKTYIEQLALAFNVDYQDFAPLPGGNLGSSAQSQILHMKSRGKGPALFMKLIAYVMNFMGVLPNNVTFEWDEQDVDEDKELAALAQTRAAERAARIASGEIDVPVAQQRALAAGDLTQEEYDGLQQRAEENKKAQEAFIQASAQAEQAKIEAEATANQNAPTPKGPAASRTTAEDEGQKALTPERLEVEDAALDHVEATLTGMYRRVAKRLHELPRLDANEIVEADDKARRPKRKRTLRTITAYEKGRPSQVLEEELV